ncbi:MAG: putative baseplate assembly protein [Gammaproteobacteria bacterium]|nr:putative baseplate assembly protein [Gammaproteobacteria bacterium]
MNFNRKEDLTRWNRAGLSKFRYIDGNAITYLETLRQQLAEVYDQQGIPVWEELVTRFPVLPGESSAQVRQRITQQYYGERRDYAWEILRTFSRSAHVLGEYLDAYANEAYLPTAVEWDNLRKLVAMLGYRPAPPASAETLLALLFKAGESGEVDKGFAVKNKPLAGNPAVIFETQEKLTGDYRLNQLRVKGWNTNLTAFGSGALISFPLAESAEQVSVGDLGVLATESRGLAVKVEQVVAGADPALSLRILSANRADTSFRFHNTRLYLDPAFVASPLPNGEGSAVLKEEANLAKDEIVFLKRNGQWQASRIGDNRHRHLQFSGSAAAPHNQDQIYRAQVLNRQLHPNLPGAEGAYVYLLPSTFSDSRAFFVNESLQTKTVSITKMVVTDSGDVVLESAVGSAEIVDRMYYIKGNLGARLYYPGGDRVTTISQAEVTGIRFSGKASDMVSGDWTIVRYQDNTRAASRISGMEQQEAWFELDLEGAGNGIALLRSAFKQMLYPLDYDRNDRPAWDSVSTDSVTVVELDDPVAAELLKPGQQMICAGGGQAVSVKVEDVIAESGYLHLSPAWHLDDGLQWLTRSDCILYGNAVQATHGETQPEKILGNGDAAKPGQTFKLPAERISWVSDPAFGTGVRADLTLTVGNRIWQQVEELSLSGPEEHHYQVKVDEAGVLSVCFGDGRHGRRLPTGIDNVRVRYRTGYGEEGNLAPMALEKMVSSHRLVTGFVAPLSTFGGAEKESVESMRENAPATVLALERAVSLDDFTHLASHHSMVWQARAFEKMPDRPGRPIVEVVVVAAGGATFFPESDTAVLIQHYLETHAAPMTPVSVISYEPVLLQLELTIMVDKSAFDVRQVEQAVAAQVQAALTLQQRRLGQALFRSEVIALLERVEGVENGHCRILDGPYSGLPSPSAPRLHRGDDGDIRRVSVKPHQLLYLDANSYPLQILSSDYQL